MACYVNFMYCKNVLQMWLSHIHNLCSEFVGRDSSVGVATGYGLDASGLESRGGGEDFHTRPYRPWILHYFLYNGIPAVFPGGNAAGAWRWPPTPV